MDVTDDLEVINALNDFRTKLLPDLKNEKSDLVWGVDYHHHWENWFNSYQTMFPLKEIEFEGINFPCVNNPEEFLKTVYCDYNKYPDKIDIGHLWCEQISDDEMDNIRKLIGSEKLNNEFI